MKIQLHLNECRAVSRGVQGVQLNPPPLQINDIHDYNYCHAFEKLRAEMYILHRRRKRGGGGQGGQLAPPPKFQVGGHRPPPNFTHCLHNELHCSIVDSRHCSSRKSHFCCLKECRPPPQVRTSSYAYVLYNSIHIRIS